MEYNSAASYTESETGDEVNCGSVNDYCMPNPTACGDGWSDMDNIRGYFSTTDCCEGTGIFILKV